VDCVDALGQLISCGCWTAGYEDYEDDEDA
jgi:hypothetical protein